MVNLEKIRNLIAKGENRNSNVEFKTCKLDVGQSVYESICAFLNRNGEICFWGWRMTVQSPELMRR